jgi:hypothetical protein
MTLVDVKGIDLSKLEKIEHVLSVDDIRCRCFPSKCCIRVQLFATIKDKSRSFIRYVSGDKKEIEELKP